MKKTDRESLSPACALVVQLGSRWALLTLFALRDRGTMRFSELVREVPGGISERMLASVLRELERMGLVERRVYPEVPPRVEYTLAEKSATLLPLLDELLEWAQRNC